MRHDHSVVQVEVPFGVDAALQHTLSSAMHILGFAIHVSGRKETPYARNGGSCLKTPSLVSGPSLKVEGEQDRSRS